MPPGAVASPRGTRAEAPHKKPHGIQSASTGPVTPASRRPHPQRTPWGWAQRPHALTELFLFTHLLVEVSVLFTTKVKDTRQGCGVWGQTVRVCGDCGLALTLVPEKKERKHKRRDERTLVPVRAEGAPSFLSVFLLLPGGEGACVTTLLEMPFSEHFSGPRDKTSI